MSLCRNTPQPMESCGIGQRLEGAFGHICPAGCRSARQRPAGTRRCPEEHCEFSRKSVTAPLLQDHDLHVHAADVADAVGIGKKMQPGGGVRHGFDHRGNRRRGCPCSRSLPYPVMREAQDFAVADHLRAPGGTAPWRLRSGCPCSMRSRRTEVPSPARCTRPWPWCEPKSQPEERDQCCGQSLQRQRAERTPGGLS